MSKLAELLAVVMSVTSRHVAHVAERGQAYGHALVLPFLNPI